MKTKLLIVLLILSLISGIAILGKLLLDQRQLNKANEQLNEQLMEADLELGRAHTEFGNAKKYSKDLEQSLQEEINKRNSWVVKYGRLQALYRAKQKSVTIEPITETGPVLVLPEAVDLVPGMLYIAGSGHQLIMIKKLEGPYADQRITAECLFTPQENNKAVPFAFNYELTMGFEGQLVETHSKTGAVNHYLTLFEVDRVTGERLGQVELTDFTVITEQPGSPQFYWWAPHLDINAMVGVGKGLSPQWGATVGLSMMGYGVTENDLSLRFLAPTIDIGNSLGVGITPIQYNLGQDLPLISNFWLGPHFGYNIDQEWYLAIVIGAVL